MTDPLGTAALSTSVVGLAVTGLPPCKQCRSIDRIIGSSKGPHAASLHCDCGRHSGWISETTCQFLAGIIENFGRPVDPIALYQNSHISADSAGNKLVRVELKPSTEKEDTTIMHINELFPSKYVKCSDLAGKPKRMTIFAVARETLNGETKAVVSFSNGDKKLVLNKTNGSTLARLLGPDTAAWSGREIVLFPTRVDFKGDSVDAIRIRAAEQPARKASNEAPPWDSDEAPFSDEIGL